jgi:hypothetical protein
MIIEEVQTQIDKLKNRLDRSSHSDENEARINQAIDFLTAFVTAMSL